MSKRAHIEAAYLREGPRIRAWLERRVGAEAEDLLHEVLSRALLNLDSLEPVRDLASWLWRGVRNAVIDLWRSRARRGTADLEPDAFADFVDEAWSEAYDEVEREELLEALADAIEALPPEQREVIECQALGGETFASLSRRTGVSPDTLAARKRYALARLREELSDYSND